MPSEIVENGLPSSSFFSDELCLPNERQVGFQKTETAAAQNGVRMEGVLGTEGRDSVASSPLEKRMSVECQIPNSFRPPSPYLIRNQKANFSLEKHAVGAERAASNSSQGLIDHNPGTRSNSNMEPSFYSMDGDGIHVRGAQYENGLFSSSLSELFSRKLRVSSSDALYGHSFGANASHYKEDEPFESLAEIEAQTIGNLLPNDDDLLSGVTDGLDHVPQTNTGEDIEDLDFFSSVGGLELGEDGFPQGQRDSEDCRLGGSMAAKYSCVERPSRTLYVQNINSNVEDSELRALFEQFGDIHTLYTPCKQRGFIMVSYYDVRAARNALRGLQNKLLRCRELDIYFSIPKDNASEKDINEGTLALFDLDSSVSNEELCQIFGVYGEIKEIQETPRRSDCKFIEYYDVRAAESALRALNRSVISGKQIKLEASRLGGARWCLTPPFPPEMAQDESAPYLRQSLSPINSTTGFPGRVSHRGITSSGMDNGIIPGVYSAFQAPISPLVGNMFHHGISSSVPNSLPSLVRVESLGNQSSLPEAGHSQGQPKIEFQISPNFHPHSLPEYHDVLTNGAPYNSPGISANISVRPSERIDNRQFCRVSSNGHPLELSDAVFVSSGNGSCSPGHHYMWSNAHHPQPQGMMWPNSPTFVNAACTAHPPNAIPRTPSHMLNPLLPTNNVHVGSAPSVNPSLWDRRHNYSGKSPNEAGFHPGSLGNMRISNSPHHLDFVSQNMFSHVGGNCMDLSIPSKNVGLHSPHLMFPGRGQMSPVTSPFESPNEWARSRRNEGSSNQADSKKLFDLDIDRIGRGQDNRTTLMIKNIPNKYTSKMLLAAIDEGHRGTYDFNKCNVGYAFINMIDPSLIIPFYQAFNGKKWEKFNSEKVASLAYARIQGKAALIAHFQNSSLMNEDKRCRPILFNTDGPNAGDQVPFPMGVNVRSRPGKTRAMAGEENHQESTLSNGEEYFDGDL
ncbi:hypothetical protein RHSIM_Rhsim12G0017500 [Rhododendron simsii]|uniref:RRM domain-containing protein n=1 Tax=Rhododendron simsii TaxID=118357 RepID=A0A834G3C2_RHOSS|nr:hypothetical protein RHSIM_Rhsim12G0017500 [Rhododendron simsii]